VRAYTVTETLLTTPSPLLDDLSVTRSLSRPRTSNDNPCSQSNFKTAKYRPDYPDRFDTIEAARTWMRRFARWYNHEHYHSGMPTSTPPTCTTALPGHHRRRPRGARRRLPSQPKRFRNRPPKAATPPTEARINNPTTKSKT
jgi:transposase InsO family protein